MHILLFIGYSILCILGLLKIPFIRNSGIRPAVLIGLFALHVATGLLHNWVAWHYYPEHGDIWTNYDLSFLYRYRLLHDRQLFFADNSTLTYFTHNGIIGIQMLLDIFSFDDLAINTLLFSFPVFMGSIALFRLFRQRYADSPITAFSILLLPSVLFWTACIHREAVLFMLFGFLLYAFDKRRYITTIVCILFILYFRFSILLSLVPALTAFQLTKDPWPRRRLLTIAASALALGIILIIVIPGPFQTLARAISFRQQEFLALEAHSRLPLPNMDGTWTSIAKVIPTALRNGLFEPLPGHGGQKIYLAFSLELLAIWLIIAAALIQTFRRPVRSASRDTRPANPAPTSPDASPNKTIPTSPQPCAPLTAFSLTFSLIGLLLIGAIVPSAGAIVRYRSIFLPFLLTPALNILPLKKINSWITLHLLTA